MPACVGAFFLFKIVFQALGTSFSVYNGMTVFGSIVLGAWRFRRPDAVRHAALPTLGAGAAAMPVTLEIRRRGHLTGRETGWVVFSGGWLVYEGLRTDFSLRPSDVVQVRRAGAATRLGLADGRIVDLTPLEDPEATENPALSEDRDRLERRTVAWRKSRCPDGASILPPEARHPTLVADRIGYGIALAFTTILVGGFALWGGATAYALGFFLLAAASLGWTAWRIGTFRRALPGLIS